MRGLLALRKGVVALGLSAVAAGFFAGPGQPVANFTMSPPGNPAVGQVVEFRDTSVGSPTSWRWDFGDGQVSSEQSPAHSYAASGFFLVTLTVSNAGGSSQQIQPLFVSSEDTLILNHPHAFTVRLDARDQRTGQTSAGHAIPQSGIFGYFSIPALTGNSENPEVFVKILDGTTVNGQFWVFYGGLTDLEYTLTVAEVSTGILKTYFKPSGSALGGFDTSGFGSSPTPTATAYRPSPTPTPPAPSPSPTRTVTPPATPTPVATPTPSASCPHIGKYTATMTIYFDLGACRMTGYVMTDVTVSCSGGMSATFFAIPCSGQTLYLSGENGVITRFAINGVFVGGGGTYSVGSTFVTGSFCASTCNDLSGSFTIFF